MELTLYLFMIESTGSDRDKIWVNHRITSSETPVDDFDWDDEGIIGYHQEGKVCLTQEKMHQLKELKRETLDNLLFREFGFDRSKEYAGERDGLPRYNCYSIDKDVIEKIQC